MSRGIKVTYDDEWILANWDTYKNWLSLKNEYNKVHGTAIGYSTFKSHCNRGLGLNFLYSEEQVEWLKSNYPKLGRVKTTEEFNKKFGTARTVGGIKVKCQKLGLKVTEERRKEKVLENTGCFVHPIGTEVTKQHGEIYIKTEDGWVRKKNLVYGKIPDGKILVHLDGNRKNCSKDNLIPITRKQSALMTYNDFWSADAEVTKTGTIWCDLAITLGEH